MYSYYGCFLLGEVAATDTPLVEVEVVGAVAEMLYEAEWRAMVGDEHKAAWRGSR